MIHRLRSGVHLSPERAQQIIEGAGRILKDLGIKITHKESLERLQREEGIKVKGNRAFISQKVYEDFLEGLKKFPHTADKHGTRLHGEASLYTYHYRHVETGQIREYTSESLAQHARFVEKAGKFYPVNPVIPGYPMDVPAELSSLARYKIAAENCSSCWPLAPDSVTAADYMYEMAGVMGEEMNHLPVYMISPLTLGGDAFEIVLKNKHRLNSFYTFSMPNMGVTTPMNLSMGMAQVLAEVAGGAILVERLTGLPGDIRPNLFPFDFVNFNIAFGTPEKFLYEQAAAELVGYIKGQDPDYSSTNIHTWAKMADGRSAMEKGMMIMAGAMSGARRFYCTGTLSLDEVFDPLQMIQDLECICFAQKILNGIPHDTLEDSFLEEVEEGMQTGFVCSDRSLDDYEEYLKVSSFSPVQNLQKWMEEGSKPCTDELRTAYEKICASPDSNCLEEEKQRELDKIYQKALEHRA